jgi:GNAT superfamily N-acetyltransferase
MSMHTLPEGYAITPAAPEDIPDLVFTDLAASQLFAGTGYIPDEELTDHVPIPLLEAAIDPGHLIVARHKGDPVGFAMTSIREKTLYLDQISVDPRHGRKGLGAALILQVRRQAVRRKLATVTLSTFRDVAWNGPFYHRLGFREVPRSRMRPWMREIEAIQAENGLDVTRRCFMVRRAGWL